MHPQGALWPMMMKRGMKRRKEPDEPALSLHGGGSRKRRRMWMGDRNLSLCGGGFYWDLGLQWLPEEDPLRARLEPEIPEAPQEVVEKEEDLKLHTVHCSRIQPLHKRAASPARPPPWWNWAGPRPPAPFWWTERQSQSKQDADP